jgi:hypothetical protein
MGGKMNERKYLVKNRKTGKTCIAVVKEGHDFIDIFYDEAELQIEAMTKPYLLSEYEIIKEIFPDEETNKVT